MTPSQSDAKAIEEFEKEFYWKKPENDDVFYSKLKDFLIHTRQEARIEELEWLRDNASGGGSWRRLIEQRITSLKNEI